MRLGVKAHWRDLEMSVGLARRHGADVLEYQMLHGDLGNAKYAFEAFLPYRDEFELRVHQPITIEIAGSQAFLDPASQDEGVRAESARVLGECARHAMELRAKALVIHPGGMHSAGEGPGTPEALAESLADIPRHVRLFLENLPAHYGPSHHSPLWTRTPDGLIPFADQVDGFVLDISHAYLARAGGSQSNVLSLARTLGPRIRHVHASGSRGADGPAGEGTTFSASDYGVDLVAEAMKSIHPEAVIVCETLGGHLDDGRLFNEDLALLAPVVLNR